MPNQLTIPFKKTYTTVPVRDAAAAYIREHTDDHPDAFRWDIDQWHALRNDAINFTVHVDRVHVLIKYHAQLVFILTKLPSDINLEIQYTCAFQPSALPISLKSVTFERAAIVFNLAALYSQLAFAEDRSNKDGLKRAANYYQQAAGAFSYLASSALPKLEVPPGSEDVPLDLTEKAARSLELLMLAQAQECIWQRAVSDNFKNGVIAKLAAKVSALYASSLEALQSAPADAQSIFPYGWLRHLDAKRCHFSAAAQYRKSVDELEGNRYGSEIARLIRSREEAKKATSAVSSGGVAPQVLQDAKSLLDVVQKGITRAERDNDLIYHQDVPAFSALPAIQEVSMVQSSNIAGLSDPKNAVPADSVLFGRMAGYAAREAINIYDHNKESFVNEHIVEVAQELTAESERVLHSLNLPSALEALEKPMGLPPSLLKKAEEVRTEQGPERIDAAIESIQTLSHNAMSVLDEAMDILDSEASEDEAIRKETPIDRLPSHEANQELVAKQQRYRTILNQANDSDEVVRQKWEQWEDHILRLTWDEETLEASVPSSTGSLSTRSQGTQVHARRLRALLESLDDVIRTRQDLVARAQRLAEADDVRPAVMRAADALDSADEAQPAVFQDVLDRELMKYDKFIQGVEAGRGRQEEILESIKATNEAFLQSRKSDVSVKEREESLQYLDFAYHKYREISQNLDEGIKFYNGLLDILMRFKEACKAWSSARSQEARSYSRPLSPASTRDSSSPGPSEHVKRSPTKRKGLGLPSLSSGDWESDGVFSEPAQH
ncbi:pH-response regulator [Coniophora puteana RWD-64-598 SS2]|uniref:pH-response regulator n=1 Tax=Coniophora puteana (strain RWD-64-598) TaxID=741705 RepID=A0A5M3MYL2_CONPW|nr:pH-response regulator [Coniophora puteana RWD-64-598 SS2]EIW83874.1 pH-response regulator [Coniophora puteana RWD-64-598 SS2]